MFEGNITRAAAAPSLGALSGGTQLSRDVVTSINRAMGAVEYFGTSRARFQTQQQTFITQFVNPIREADRLINNTARRVLYSDEIRPLITEEDLRHCPPSMMIPIMALPIMHSLHQQGRVDGFGLDPNGVVPFVDVYTRILDTNGVCELHSSTLGEDSCIYYTIEEHSTDPQHTLDEIEALVETRTFIKELLDTTRRDPTDLDNLRG